MRGILRTLALLMLATLTASPARATVFAEIERRHARGEINTPTYHHLRVTAIRAPAELPPDLQDAAQTVLRRSGTSILVEAAQWLFALGAADDPLHALLSPPADLTHSIDSTLYPIRVLYDNENATAAYNVLSAAEESWHQQVDVWGWRAPLFEPDRGPYRIYVSATGSGVAGYAVPYARNLDTPHADCFTYIFISPNLGSYTPATVAHELSHAMQAATDCDEVISYWENTAVFIEAATFPNLALQALWSMYSFQSAPWRSLDHFEYGQGYQYGGALWNIFLADAFATPDTGPVLIRDIWEASMQEEPGNSVTYFDGTNTVLSEITGTASPMEATFMDFCEARYFVGAQDDGAHIDGAGQWWFGELTLAERHTVFELPLMGAMPPSTRRPAPFGSNHIRVDLPAGHSVPMRFRIQGSEATRWAARVVGIGGEPTSHVDLDIDPTTGQGETTVPSEGRDALLLVVANLGPEGFRPGVGRRNGADYRYDIVPVIAAPTVTAADPPQIVAGQQNLSLRLMGRGFVLGRDFRVYFEDPTIQVTTVVGVIDDEVQLRITVPGLTTPGPKSVMVTNHGGATGVGVDVITILPRDDASSDTGCTCQGGPTATGAPALVLVMALLWGWRRRGTKSTHRSSR